MNYELIIRNRAQTDIAEIMLWYEENESGLGKYRRDWPKAFEEEKKAIIALGILGIEQIHHIGSTAVEGLPARAC